MSRTRFPVVIYRMLENPSITSLVWDDETGGIRVTDRQQLWKDIKKYKKGVKFGSFVRQLNLYGFSKPRPGVNVWIHPIFSRGYPEQSMAITRKSRKEKPFDISIFFA